MDWPTASIVGTGTSSSWDACWNEANRNEAEPNPKKNSNAHSQPQEWRLCMLPLKSVPLQRSAQYETWTWISPESLLWQEMTEIRFRVHRYQAFVCLCKVFPTWFLSRMCGSLNMTASCCGRGVSQHVTQVYSVDQVDQLKAAISCILCGSPGALRNFAQHI